MDSTLYSDPQDFHDKYPIFTRFFFRVAFSINISCTHAYRLHFNRFSGPIPSEIADARGLRTLSLSENALTGRIPAALGTLPKLNKLLLGSNRLEGRIPWELTNLAPTLADLVLSDNPDLQPDTPAARERRRCQLPNCRISL